MMPGWQTAGDATAAGPLYQGRTGADGQMSSIWVRSIWMSNGRPRLTSSW